ncbi:UDP-glucose 4-epimerase GalE [Streptomyces sp. NPDC091377]|uniref:UDP-glucose 4-epimerase GalE n=1 Tax=Streptomyces sp. NPDC091377 TaxID=3365995 RepID=UPI0037FE0FA1
MRVLVTGGAGYVGSFTVRDLLAAGHEPLVVDNLSSGRREAVADVPLTVADVRDKDGLREVFRRFRPRAVLHFAGLKSSQESLTDITTYYDVNVVGTHHVLAACADTGVERFVFSSSCAVYGTPPACPVDESAPIRPESPYGETKYLGERMIASYADVTGMRHASLRYFNAAGADPDRALGEYTGASSGQLLPAAVRAALGRTPGIEVFGQDHPTPDGTALRDYVHVVDLARAHVRVLDHLDTTPWSGVVNLGAGRPVSVRELLDTVRSVSGRDFDIRPAPRRPGDPGASWADPTLARERFGWKPEHGLDAVVRTAWAWHTSVPTSLG